MVDYLFVWSTLNGKSEESFAYQRMEYYFCE